LEPSLQAAPEAAKIAELLPRASVPWCPLNNHRFSNTFALVFGASAYAMLLNGASAVNRAFRGLPEAPVPHTDGSGFLLMA
jgi:hypothetical protein